MADYPSDEPINVTVKALAATDLDVKAIMVTTTTDGPSLELTPTNMKAEELAQRIKSSVFANDNTTDKRTLVDGAGLVVTCHTGTTQIRPGGILVDNQLINGLKIQSWDLLVSMLEDSVSENKTFLGYSNEYLMGDGVSVGFGNMTTYPSYNILIGNNIDARTKNNALIIGDNQIQESYIYGINGNASNDSMPMGIDFEGKLYTWDKHQYSQPLLVSYDTNYAEYGPTSLSITNPLGSTMLTSTELSINNSTVTSTKIDTWDAKAAELPEFPDSLFKITSPGKNLSYDLSGLSDASTVSFPTYAPYVDTGSFQYARIGPDNQTLDLGPSSLLAMRPQTVCVGPNNTGVKTKSDSGIVVGYNNSLDALASKQIVLGFDNASTSTAADSNNILIGRSITTSGTGETHIGYAPASGQTSTQKVYIYGISNATADQSATAVGISGNQLVPYDRYNFDAKNILVTRAADPIQCKVNNDYIDIITTTDANIYTRNTINGYAVNTSNARASVAAGNVEVYGPSDTTFTKIRPGLIEFDGNYLINKSAVDNWNAAYAQSVTTPVFLDTSFGIKNGSHANLLQFDTTALNRVGWSYKVVPKDFPNATWTFVLPHAEQTNGFLRIQSGTSVPVKIGSGLVNLGYNNGNASDTSTMVTGITVGYDNTISSYQASNMILGYSNTINTPYTNSLLIGSGHSTTAHGDMRIGSINGATINTKKCYIYGISNATADQTATAVGITSGHQLVPYDRHVYNNTVTVRTTATPNVKTTISDTSIAVTDGTNTSVLDKTSLTLGTKTITGSKIDAWDAKAAEVPEFLDTAFAIKSGSHTKTLKFDTSLLSTATLSGPFYIKPTTLPSNTVWKYTLPHVNETDGGMLLSGTSAILNVYGGGVNVGYNNGKASTQLQGAYGVVVGYNNAVSNNTSCIFIGANLSDVSDNVTKIGMLNISGGVSTTKCYIYGIANATAPALQNMTAVGIDSNHQLATYDRDTHLNPVTVRTTATPTIKTTISDTAVTVTDGTNTSVLNKTSLTFGSKTITGSKIDAWDAKAAEVPEFLDTAFGIKSGSHTKTLKFDISAFTNAIAGQPTVKVPNRINDIWNYSLPLIAGDTGNATVYLSTGTSNPLKIITGGVHVGMNNGTLSDSVMMYNKGIMIGTGNALTYSDITDITIGMANTNTTSTGNIIIGSNHTVSASKVTVIGNWDKTNSVPLTTKCTIYGIDNATADQTATAVGITSNHQLVPYDRYSFDAKNILVTRTADPIQCIINNAYVDIKTTDNANIYTRNTINGYSVKTPTARAYIGSGNLEVYGPSDTTFTKIRPGVVEFDGSYLINKSAVDKWNAAYAQAVTTPVFLDTSFGIKNGSHAKVVKFDTSLLSTAADSTLYIKPPVLPTSWKYSLPTISESGYGTIQSGSTAFVNVASSGVNLGYNNGNASTAGQNAFGLVIGRDNTPGIGAGSSIILGNNNTVSNTACMFLGTNLSDIGSGVLKIGLLNSSGVPTTIRCHIYGIYNASFQPALQNMSAVGIDSNHQLATYDRDTHLNPVTVRTTATPTIKTTISDTAVTVTDGTSTSSLTKDTLTLNGTSMTSAQMNIVRQKTYGRLPYYSLTTLLANYSVITGQRLLVESEAGMVVHCDTTTTITNRSSLIFYFVIPSPVNVKEDNYAVSCNIDRYSLYETPPTTLSNFACECTLVRQNFTSTQTFHLYQALISTKSTTAVSISKCRIIFTFHRITGTSTFTTPVSTTLGG